MMRSFGPTAALSALSNTLNQTLASGNRVLNLLAEEPVVMDVESNVEVPDEDVYKRQVLVIVQEYSCFYVLPIVV